MARRFLCLALLATTSSLFGHDATAGPAAGNGPRPIATSSGRALATPAGIAARRLVDAEASMTATIEQEGRAKVADLVRQMQATLDRAQRQALGRQIAESKLDTDLQVLRFRADFARGSGDLALAQRYENAIEALLHPVIRAAVSNAAKKGGR